MTVSEPTGEQQTEWHKRIVSQDVTAFAELCEAALPYLHQFLQKRFPAVEAHLHEMMAIDSLLAYQANPEKYDPQRLSLFAYLRMAARNDLLNALDKQQRYDKRLLDIDDPSLQTQLPSGKRITNEFEVEEWLGERTSYSSEEIFQSLDDELNEIDRNVVLLMLDGVRDSRQYASAMGISHLDTGQQRSEVKRAKDRLTKKLRRFGDQFDGQ